MGVPVIVQHPEICGGTGYHPHRAHHLPFCLVGHSSGQLGKAEQTSLTIKCTTKQISALLQETESPSDDPDNLSSSHSWLTTGSNSESIRPQGKLMTGPQTFIKQQDITQHTRPLKESRLSLRLNRVYNTRDIRAKRDSPPRMPTTTCEDRPSSTPLIPSRLPSSPITSSSS